MSGEPDAVPEDLLQLAERAAVPHLAARPLHRRFGPRSTWIPVRGQIWRAEREDVAVLLLLLDVDVDSVVGAPVTVDRTAEDDTLVLDGTALGVPVTVWAGLRRSLPTSVLDRPVDETTTDVVGRVEQVSVVDRPAATGPTADAADIRAELEDELAILSDARAEAHPATPTAASDLAAGVDIDAIEPAALDEAASRMNVPLAAVLDLIDGKRQATPAEADVLRAVLGATPVAAPPPAGLVVELVQPRWRGLVREHGRRGRLTDQAAREAMAYEVNAMAARQTGHREPAWPERIRLWAQVHRLDLDADV